MNSIKKLLKFIRNLFSSKGKFDFNIGEAVVLEKSIIINSYPFESSSIFPAKEIPASEIKEIHLDKYPPSIKLNDELIFISREHLELLKNFAMSNNIPTPQRQSNWDFITESFLDMEFEEESKKRTIEYLLSNGFTKVEISNIRNEVRKQMMKYNFNTMLWEWRNLGLCDVLIAMKPSLSKEDFKDFYFRAMEIEMRTK